MTFMSLPSFLSQTLAGKPYFNGNSPHLSSPSPANSCQNVGKTIDFSLGQKNSKKASNVMKIVVTGAYGQLGGEICRQLGATAIPTDVDTLDLTNGQAVFERMIVLKPDAIINCAAYTQVDKAEAEPEKCRAVNATAVENLARASKYLDCPMVQISTDYVFGAVMPNPRPWREDDPTAPQGVYAQTKLEGEQIVARHAKHLIVRTCGLYAQPSDLRAVNFVRTMLRLGASRPELRIVSDQHCTPTYVPHLAKAIRFLLEAAPQDRAPWGVYHVTNTGEATWAEFAAEIFRLANLSVTIHPITTTEYGAPAARPSYSVLDTSAYHRLAGPRMPDWRAALAEYFSELQKTSAAVK
jgi:dTDP-4-dehydrorhamnose reductase